MKKSMMFITMIFSCISGFTAFAGSNWLETSDGKIDCRQITLGLTKATVVLEDGKTVDYNFDEINSFSQDGKQYNKLMLYEDNKATNQMVFMELIKTWNDLSLYKFTYKGLQPSGVTDRYYLYKGTDYHVQLDERSLKNTCKQFGVNMAEI